MAWSLTLRQFRRILRSNVPLAIQQDHFRDGRPINSCGSRFSIGYAHRPHSAHTSSMRLVASTSDNGGWAVLIPQEELLFDISDTSLWYHPTITGGDLASSIRRLNDTTFVAVASHGSGSIVYRKRHCASPPAPCSLVVYYYLTAPNRPVFGLPNGAHIITVR